MINKIVLEDKIILFWDRAKEFLKGYKYCVHYNRDIVYTDKTHFTIEELAPNSCVEIAVYLVDAQRRIVKEYEKEKIYLTSPKRKIDVTQAPYFAVGDGKTINTEKIQRALSDCKKGEVVYIPKGIYLTGALDMHSDTQLYIEENAVLQGTEKPEDYLPKIKSRFEGIEGMCYRSLINMGKLDSSDGYNCKNVVIGGKGAILGGGRALMENIIKLETGRDYICQDVIDATEREARRTRGRLINVSNSQNVVIYGLEIGMAPAWNIHMIYSDNVVTAGCFIHSEGINNGDGWDPDSSTNCTIFNCDFHTRDDMVAIKSGKNPEGNVINRPSQNIRVFDCRSTMGHGIAMGSEMSGGISDVYIWDCDIETSRCGLEIKGTKKRGGYIKNVFVNNCKTPLIAIREVEYNDDGQSAPVAPTFENYRFEDVSVSGIYTLHTGETRNCPPIIVNGFENGDKVKNVVFKNVNIKRAKEKASQTLEICYVADVSFENVFCE